MDLETLEKLLELMHANGVLSLKHGDIEVQLDPRTIGASKVEEAEIPANAGEVVVTGEDAKQSRMNPLLRNKALGLTALFSEKSK